MSESETFIHKAIDDLKISVTSSDHSLSKVYEDVWNLQKADGVKSVTWSEDLAAINTGIHNAYLLPSLNLTGFDSNKNVTFTDSSGKVVRLTDLTNFSRSPGDDGGARTPNMYVNDVSVYKQGDPGHTDQEPDYIISPDGSIRTLHDPNTNNKQKISIELIPDISGNITKTETNLLNEKVNDIAHEFMQSNQDGSFKGKLEDPDGLVSQKVAQEISQNVASPTDSQQTQDTSQGTNQSKGSDQSDGQNNGSDQGSDQNKGSDQSSNQNNGSDQGKSSQQTFNLDAMQKTVASMDGNKSPESAQDLGSQGWGVGTYDLSYGLINSWLGSLGLTYPITQEEEAKIQALIKAGKLSETQAHALDSPSFGKLLAALKSGQKPTTDEIKSLPQDLQQKISGDLISMFKTQLEQGSSTSASANASKNLKRTGQVLDDHLNNNYSQYMVNGSQDYSKTNLKGYSSDKAVWNDYAYSACSTTSMTEIMDAYGAKNSAGQPLSIGDVLNAQVGVGAITPELGLTGHSGIESTVTQFGFTASDMTNPTVQSIIQTANSGKPVMVGYPDHWLVVTGGDSQYVYLADSSKWNRTKVPISEFENSANAWDGKNAVVITPKNGLVNSGSSEADPGQIALAMHLGHVPTPSELQDSSNQKYIKKADSIYQSDVSDDDAHSKLTDPDSFFTTQFQSKYNVNGLLYNNEDCGATSLTMLLAKYGKINLDASSAASEISKTVQAVTGDDPSLQSTNEEGANLSNLQKAAKNRGLQAGIVTGIDGDSGIDQALNKGQSIILAGNPKAYEQGGVFVGTGYSQKEQLDGTTYGNNAKYDGMHFIALVGKTSDGKYIINDPLSRNGSFAISRDELEKYMSDPNISQAYGDGITSGNGVAVWSTDTSKQPSRSDKTLPSPPAKDDSEMGWGTAYALTKAQEQQILDAFGGPKALPSGGYQDDTQCTYWAARVHGVTWKANAADWLTEAQAAGVKTNGPDNPTVGAVVVFGPSSNPYEEYGSAGHVAIVTNVNKAQGTITIAEENYSRGYKFPNAGTIDMRTIPISDAAIKGYIP